MAKQLMENRENQSLRKKLLKLSPVERIRLKKELKAIKELAGLWEDKDTSFFEKR